MPYTTHGHWFGFGEPTLPKPDLRARCGGPPMCSVCNREAMDFEKGQTTFLLVTIKLPRTAQHDPYNKVVGTCLITGETCTDVTGEHHTALWEGDDMEAAKFHYRNFHITRIERVVL